MATHWLLLLVGATLIQGVFLRSPVPILEEEWEEYERMMRSPEYRLPTTTRPRHYEVSITPYFDTPQAGVQPFSFTGDVVIYISPTVADVNQIIMHCNDLVVSSVTVIVDNTTRQIQSNNQDLQCEMPYSFLRINLNETLELNQEYVVSMSFTGNIQDNMRGFYRSWYIDSSNNTRWMGTTQFQPGHARQAFPCYDEPSFKATFDITIVREASFSPTISNMPIRSNVTVANGRVAETFYTTPLTSTYLLAFIVSHYIEVASGTDQNRPFGIYARDNAGSTGDFALEIGEALLASMEQYTQISYYNMTENINMKQAAIPDFSAGAMENWGLLTYREALLLYDPLNSNNFYRQRIANIVAHEVTHMWFGNLVTCAWWDNLWLNEGFARFYTYFLAESVAPEMQFETRFLVEQHQDALFADSVDTAHALTNPAVNTPTQVSNHFSTITYARGASILRMTEHLLGSDTFVKGLRAYLQARAFDVAEPHHLFEALDAAAFEDASLGAYGGITVDRYFRSWSEKAGHPLLTVRINQATGRMTVTQARWERNTGVSQNDVLWDIPITWTRGNNPDFEDLKPSRFITVRTTTIERGTQGLEWVVFNKQSAAFYRVNYDDTNWALITQALRQNISVIHHMSRSQIVDDLFALGRAGVLRYERVLNALSFLEFEDQYAPWISAISGFNFLINRLSYDQDRLNELYSLIINLSAGVTSRLGFVERDNESYMDGLLRMYVMQLLCNVGHPQCVQTGIQYFANWTNGQYVPPNMRPWVYCTGLRQGSAADFNYFWNRYLNEDLSNEQVIMLQVAGCTTNQDSLEVLLDAIVSDAQPPLIREQDVNTALNNAVSRNAVNPMRAFQWLQRNVANVTAALGSVSAPLNQISQRLQNENDTAVFLSWLEENRNLIGNASYNTGVNGINTARSNLAWSTSRQPEISQFISTGYVEETIVNPLTTEGPTSAPTTNPTQPPSVGTTEGPTQGPTEGPTSPPSPGSTEAPITSTTPDGAATIALSFVALLASVAINLVN